jgi:3-hydroxyanthranilate 3,4-dioxygenase
MWSLAPINFKKWVEENRDLLKPPVGNKRIYIDTGFVVQVVGGPNSRKDFHDDPGEEFFYQIEGDMLLKTMQDGKPKDISIREGDILLIPPHLLHSPQRFADTVGLVIERPRTPGERDGLLWFCENCDAELYREYFELTNIETQFPPVFDRFFGNLEKRTCKHCGTVMEAPQKKK